MKKSKALLLVSPAGLYVVIAVAFALYVALSTEWDAFASIGGTIILVTILSAIPIVVSAIISLIFYLKFVSHDDAKSAVIFRNALLISNITGLVIFLVGWLVVGVTIVPLPLEVYAVIIFIPLLLFVALQVAAVTWFFMRAQNYLNQSVI